MAGKFEVCQAKAGDFRFRRKAGNGAIIAVGEGGYRTKAAARSGIESVKASAPAAAVVDVAQ